MLLTPSQASGELALYIQHSLDVSKGSLPFYVSGTGTIAELRDNALVATSIAGWGVGTISIPGIEGPLTGETPIADTGISAEMTIDFSPGILLDGYHESLTTFVDKMEDIIRQRESGAEGLTLYVFIDTKEGTGAEAISTLYVVEDTEVTANLQLWRWGAIFLYPEHQIQSVGHNLLGCQYRLQIRNDEEFVWSNGHENDALFKRLKWTFPYERECYGMRSSTQNGGIIALTSQPFDHYKIWITSDDVPDTTLILPSDATVADIRDKLGLFGGKLTYNTQEIHDQQMLSDIPLAVDSLVRYHPGYHESLIEFYHKIDEFISHRLSGTQGLTLFVWVERKLRNHNVEKTAISMVALVENQSGIQDFLHDFQQPEMRQVFADHTRLQSLDFGQIKYEVPNRLRSDFGHLVWTNNLSADILYNRMTDVFPVQTECHGYDSPNGGIMALQPLTASEDMSDIELLFHIFKDSKLNEEALGFRTYADFVEAMPDLEARIERLESGKCAMKVEFHEGSADVKNVDIQDCTDGIHPSELNMRIFDRRKRHAQFISFEM